MKKLENLTLETYNPKDAELICCVNSRGEDQGYRILDGKPFFDFEYNGAWYGCFSNKQQAIALAKRSYPPAVEHINKVEIVGDMVHIYYNWGHSATNGWSNFYNDGTSLVKRKISDLRKQERN